MENDHDLVERVERLERVVEGLLARDPAAAAALREGRDTPPGERPSIEPPRPTPVASPPPRAPVAPPRVTKPGSGIELRSFLRVVGIALLLFGVAFLFKYSESESAYLRSIRVAIGVSLGIGLALVGRALLSRDRPFAQVLTGGGIAVWYMSGFAAYQLFDLVPAPPAFVYMAIVTLAAFAISIRQDAPALSVVATLGGIATPFLLYDPARSTIGVVVYVAAVASTAIAVYLRRNWPVLLHVAAISSACSVMATAMQHFVKSTTPDSERWNLEGGLLYLFALFAATAHRGYGRIARTGKLLPQHDSYLILAAMVPVATIFLTHAIWQMPQQLLGQLCVATALAYAGATIVTFPVFFLQRMANMYLLVASTAGAFGALALVDGEMQHLAIASEALLLRMLARRAGLQAGDAVSHLLFLVAGCLVVRDLVMNTPPGVPLFNRAGITTMWSIIAAVVAALSMEGSKAPLRRFYLYAAHTLLLAWILHEFVKQPNGQAVVTIIWGVYGASLLVTGLRRTIRPMRTVGLLTLFLVVGKLFMVDLDSVPAIWRVLLFIGFGGVFLALSYWFLSLDRSARHKSG